MRKSIKDIVINWWNTDKKRTFIISGYAGCGKTTLAREIPNELNLNYSAVFLAPTGKAARVLHKNASTIHSYLYEAEVDPITKKITWHKKSYDSFHDKLLIVDEISMVNKELMADLKWLNIPIIGLGDPAQLPPVQGSNDILDNPDIFLTKVYRNAGGILDYATNIRKDEPIKDSYPNVEFRQRLYKDLNKYDEDSIIICKYNKSRQSINRMIREKVYEYKELIEIGEKMIILNNNRDFGLFNGSIVTVDNVVSYNDKDNTAIIVVTDDEGVTQEIEIDTDILKGVEEKPKKFLKKKDIFEIEYAYCVTCHKAQGSEFQQVFVLMQGKHHDDYIKWLYTAVTRARKKLFMYD